MGHLSRQTNQLFNMDIADQPQLNVLICALVHVFIPDNICSLKSCAAIIGTAQ